MRVWRHILFTHTHTHTHTQVLRERYVDKVVQRRVEVLKEVPTIRCLELIR